MLNVPTPKFSKKSKQLLKLRLIQILLALVLGLAAAAALVLWQANKDELRRIALQDAAEQVVPETDIPPNTKTVGGPFTLINQDGKTVTDADYRGKYLLIYFGYTYCPDLCPTGLQSIAHALDQLDTESGKVQSLYVTIDPVRDTPAKLKEYISSFHPEIVGLTGSPAQIAAVAKAYQVYYAKGQQVDEHDYLMDHSSLIYLMGPDGKFIATFPENVDPAKLVTTLRRQWREKPASSMP
ncbi:MAG: SCO family protein [Pseudomonadota bacterium]|nr:SCO family protein [Pseudomonadota bacterium]